MLRTQNYINDDGNKNKNNNKNENDKCDLSLLSIRGDCKEISKFKGILFTFPKEKENLIYVTSSKNSGLIDFKN